VGDSAKVYLHSLSGGRCTTFTSIMTLTLPPMAPSPVSYATSSPVASFSTAFSTNGTKFAVASQEGSVVIWDVRSSKPLKIYHTDQTRASVSKTDGNGSASGWLSDDPWDWSRGGSRAPGWGVRSVKFGSGGAHGHPGKEFMIFTEVRGSRHPKIDKESSTNSFKPAHIPGARH
jgi:WD40 repeat protein